jgi:phosphoribosylcarboxyaminoimidazole (NCAIR) mutase
MPSGVSPLVIIDPENAALAAAKILALCNSDIYETILNHQRDVKNKIELDDEESKSACALKSEKNAVN